MEGFCRLSINFCSFKSDPRHFIHAGDDGPQSFLPLQIHTDTPLHTYTKYCSIEHTNVKWNLRFRSNFFFQTRQSYQTYLNDLTHFDVGLLSPRYALCGCIVERMVRCFFLDDGGRRLPDWLCRKRGADSSLELMLTISVTWCHYKPTLSEVEPHWS